MSNITKFKGTDTYIATQDLMVSVNAAISLEKPLIIKGEPGTGKTLLASEIAKVLKKKLISWHIKSTTNAQQGLYEYDFLMTYCWNWTRWSSIAMNCKKPLKLKNVLL